MKIGYRSPTLWQRALAGLGRPKPQPLRPAGPAGGGGVSMEETAEFAKWKSRRYFHLLFAPLAAYLGYGVWVFWQAGNKMSANQKIYLAAAISSIGIFAVRSIVSHSTINKEWAEYFVLRYPQGLPAEFYDKNPNAAMKLTMKMEEAKTAALEEVAALAQRAERVRQTGFIPEFKDVPGESFRIMTEAVTVAQFRHFVEETDYEIWGQGALRLRTRLAERALDNVHLTFLNWKDTDAYAAWLGERNNKTCEVPTLAEWSVAEKALGGELRRDSLEWRKRAGAKLFFLLRPDSFNPVAEGSAGKISGFLRRWRLAREYWRHPDSRFNDIGLRLIEKEAQESKGGNL